MTLSTGTRRALATFALVVMLVAFFQQYSYRSVVKKGIRKIGARGFRKQKIRANDVSSTDPAARYQYENIMKMKPIRYLPNFKNPCWIGTKDNGPIHDKMMHCLPYFFVIGIKKCGTSDIFTRIMRHPDAVYPGFKEAQWFPRRRFKINTRVQVPMNVWKGNRSQDSTRLEYYIHMFDRATQQIKLNHNAYSNRNANNSLITGEGTPANLHIQGYWDVLPGNKGLSEPRYTILHYIKHLMPDVKIIISFRNPVDRLYSDFLHSHKNKTSSVFHNYVVSTISMYQECFDRFSFRTCMFNHTLITKTNGVFAFTAGFYAFHMKEIRNVFSKNQVLPVLFDDYISDMQTTLTRLYRFLGLRNLRQPALENILRSRARNSGAKRKQRVGPMLNKTIALLERYYRPYNAEMAKLMNDDRYLFRKYKLNQ